MASHRWRFAGTTDLIASNHNGLICADWKGTVGPEAQIQLGAYVILWKEAHPDLEEREVKALAMKEWVGENPDSPDSLAAHFGDYLNDPAHEHEQCNLSDPAAVKHLLEEIRHYKPTPDTLH